MASSVSSTGGLSSTIRGYGGLASGLDRDELIQQMTAGTRSKIAQQKQKKQKLEWTQTALRGITSKIYNFSSSFTSYASPTNLTSSKMFARSLITANGANGKFVSVTGSASSSNTMSIARIKQLASNASLSTGEVSRRTLETAGMNAGENGKLDQSSDVSTIVGDSLYIGYGESVFSVTMADKEEYNYSTPEGAIAAINEQLKGVNIGSGKTLADVMEVSLENGKVAFSAKEGAAGNLVQLAGGTGDILKDLGVLSEGQTFADLSAEDKTISNYDGKLIASNNQKLTENQTLAKQLSGKELSFVYNGQVKWITTDEYRADQTLEDVAKDLQSKLDAAFGKGRVSVKAEEVKDANVATGEYRLSFKTMKPGGAEEDTSSTLAITSGVGVMGHNGAFGIVNGSGNRLNTSANLKESGLLNADKFTTDADGNYNLMINGVKIEGITQDTTMSEIINKINNSEAGVKVSYQAMSDRFVIASTENGASGQIYFGEKPGDEVANDNIAKYLFGNQVNGKTEFNVIDGQDAVFSVNYPDSDQEIEITRGTNTFTLDGMSITLKGTFGYESKTENNVTSLIKTEAEAITFTAEVDADKTADAVKNMIDAFNEIVELVNKEGKTKPNRDYAPLTDEQKAELSEDQIKNWEEKAKEGLLFGDMDIRMMADALRTVMSSMDRATLSNMGITVSTSYNDNGKLVFDAEKFKTALREDPDAVREVLNREAVKDEEGNTIPGGLLTRIKTVMDNYGSVTGSTKGILIERAGSIYAPTSVLKNNIQKQMDAIDDYVVKLTKRLAKEQDRYISQFTTLETLMSQMNSQSSYLSSMFA